MSQETLSEMIGTTRSRVISLFLNRFRELGFINYNGGGMEVHIPKQFSSRVEFSGYRCNESPDRLSFVAMGTQNFDGSG
jgi:hypothetical protein